MKRVWIIKLSGMLSGILLGGVALAGGEHEHAASGPAALERFRALAGDWVAAEDNEMARRGDLVARYAVTASGSAVVETVFPGTAHEMVTVYTAEGSDVVLTHYCAGGNQPRMRARGATADQVDFAFDGGANLDPQTTPHMHSATFWFLGANELRSEWRELAGGQPGTVIEMHTRRKTS